MKRLLTAVFLVTSTMSMTTVAAANDSHMYDQLDMPTAIPATLTQVAQQYVAHAKEALESYPNSASDDLRAMASFTDIDGIRDAMLAATLEVFTMKATTKAYLLAEFLDYRFRNLMGYHLGDLEGYEFNADGSFFAWVNQNAAVPKPDELNLGFHLESLYQSTRIYVTIYRMARRISEIAPAVPASAVVYLREFKPTPAFAESRSPAFAATEFAKPDEPGMYDLEQLSDRAGAIFEFMVNEMEPNVLEILQYTEWAKADFDYDDGNTPESFIARTKELQALMSATSN